jgi:hypothetical protein
MSQNRFVWNGLEELKAALRALPADLAAEAGHLVTAAANGAAADIRRSYPVHSGNLRDHITVDVGRGLGPFGAGSVVKNTARHAYLFEVGTQARHTDLGWNRGRMPAAKVFIPTTRRWRRKMYAELAKVVERHGLRVTGTVD